MRRILLMVCVFFSVLLFSGCGFTPPAGERRDASTLSDGRWDANASLPLQRIEQWSGYDLPLRLGSVRDGGVESEPVGRALTTSVCDGQNLRLSPEAERYARSGYQLWHLCYRTPTRSTSTDALATMRPASVVVSVFHESSRTLRETMTVPVTTSERSQMMNVLVILSANTRPFFFIENRYPSGATLGAVTESTETGDILTHGELQMRHVNAAGHQETTVPGVGVVCAVTHSTNMRRELFFIPYLACLGGFESCRLGAYDCRDLLSLPF